MKIILALDLGVVSIGWALIEDNEGKLKILGIGSRIIDFENSEASKFGNGTSISKNAERTKMRTARKCYDRYILRRTALTDFFREYDMLPDEKLIKMDKLSLWKLRANAVNNQVSLTELARVLYHINQKRGYKSSKSDDSDSQMRAYVSEIYKRNDVIRQENMTIGQYFYSQLQNNSFYRCKNQIFPRIAYEEEFDKIVSEQRKYYPTILTDENIKKLRDKIIFYHRGLKSCKRLVSYCELEKKELKRPDGTSFIIGPKVAHSSNPLSQVCRIWEAINNINISDIYGNALMIDIEKKKDIFNFLNYHKTITISQFTKLLNINKDLYNIDKDTLSSLKGNITAIDIMNAVNKDKKICDKIFDFHNSLFVEKVNIETGEIINQINPEFEKSYYYQLWHTIYSIPNKEDIKKTLIKNFEISDSQVLENLSSIHFEKLGYSKKSVKAISKILPYMVDGYNYYESKILAGYNDHPLTKQENESRVLLTQIPLLEKNALRQPLVEKILNQMINLVNAIIKKYDCGFDEIRIELARELKQSKEERLRVTKRNSENKRINDNCILRIKEFGITPSKSKVEKYKLAEETNNTCIYCGKHIELVDFLSGYGYEIEHIIPKSIVFDDSFSNKVCSCSNCNKEKNNQTAYDYMKNKDFETYILRVNDLFQKNKISKAKRDNLLTPIENVSGNFIERQLRQTQYISKMACKILNSVCYNVTTTTGSVTDYLRRIWGWKNILEDLNKSRFRLAGLTEAKDIIHNGSIIRKEAIVDWSKRKDHRHHAIDALVIACTPQSFIQRLNKLNSIDDVPFKSIKDQGKEQKERYSKLDKYAINLPHFYYNEVKDAVSNILISFKSTRKVTTPGKRYIYINGTRKLVQTGLMIPRGSLCEESVYGKIHHKGNDEIVIKYKLGVGQGFLFYTAKQKKDQIEKTIGSIVDTKIQNIVREHIGSNGYNLSNCFKEPLYFNKHVIHSVRCLTGLKSTIPVRRNRDGSVSGYVKPGAIQNISIYKDLNENFYENPCTFWHAVERKIQHIPNIITKPNEVWDYISNLPSVSDNFLEQLPKPNSEFIVSIQRDDMFVMGMDDDDFEYAIKTGDMKAISENLYKVQNASSGNYRFCLHTLTEFDLHQANKEDKRFLNITSLKSFFTKNPHKVRIDILGNIYLIK